MTSELPWVGQLVSEPVGAVDAGDRLALRKIQDEAAAERFDARLQKPPAPLRSNV